MARHSKTSLTESKHGSLSCIIFYCWIHTFLMHLCSSKSVKQNNPCLKILSENCQCYNCQSHTGGHWEVYRQVNMDIKANPLWKGKSLMAWLFSLFCTGPGHEIQVPSGLRGWQIFVLNPMSKVRSHTIFFNIGSNLHSHNRFSTKLWVISEHCRFSFENAILSTANKSWNHRIFWCGSEPQGSPQVQLLK